MLAKHVITGPSKNEIVFAIQPDETLGLGLFGLVVLRIVVLRVADRVRCQLSIESMLVAKPCKHVQDAMGVSVSSILTIYVHPVKNDNEGAVVALDGVHFPMLEYFPQTGSHKAVLDLLPDIIDG